MYVLTWCIGLSFDNPLFNYHKQSARNVGIYPIPIGSPNQRYSSHVLKVDALLQALSLPFLKSEDILICVDGSDTLFIRDIQSIYELYKSFNTELLFSTEKYFAWGLDHLRPKFDKINSPYRYINGGGFIGTVNIISKLVRDVSECELYSRVHADQTLYMDWAHSRMDNPEVVQLDTECKIFWTIASSLDYIDRNINNSEVDILINPETKYKPCILHNTANQDYYDIYHRLYYKIIQNFSHI